jgi:signal transduction histidine kinase/DNA-binding NarL/FixJ family response regulator
MELGAAATHPRVNKRVALVCSLACIVVAALFVLLFTQMRGAERRAYQTQLETIASEQTALLTSRVASAQQVLDTLVSLWEVDLVSSREDFAVFTRRALPTHPELHALEWVPRVHGEDRAAYERAARDDGYAHYALRPFDPAATLPSDENFPVYYAEPFAGNEDALGLDLATEVERRAGLERARDTGRASATGTLHLVQRPGGALGFLVFAPVYCRAASLDTVEGRRRALTGFVTGVFRLDDLARASLADAAPAALSVTVVDEANDAEGTGPEGEGSRSAAAGAEGYLPPTRALEIGGRRWAVRFGPSAKEITPVSLHSRWVLPLGFICTILFGAYLFAAVRRAVEVERRVRERTAALSTEIATRAAELARSNRALQHEVAVRVRAEQEAARANDAKSLFLASMSHEIRTPLNAILGYAQILQADPTLPSASLAAVQKIATSGGHLSGLLSEILDLSQIEAGRADLRCAEFDLAELLMEVGVVFENACSEKGLLFRLEDLPPLGTRVLGDAGKLRQILINLVGNAVKFTPAGVVGLRLTLGSGDEFVFDVMDTGVGIPDGAFDEVLLPFHQESAGRTLGGTGLGLAIARRYADLMGARLLIRSKVGEGSTFSLAVSLPSAGAPSQATARRRWRLPPGVEVTALIVDDVAENRDVLATMLEGLGCRVTRAAGGAEALALTPEIFQRDRLASCIVFLDVRMPGVDGLAVVERLREAPLRGLRVVAHSASALAHEQAEYRRAGFDDFLAKPVTEDAVRACLSLLPGVAFEPDVPAAYGARAEPEELAGAAPLPPALRERIRLAAANHNATVLRSCLREVEDLGPAQRPWLGRLRHAMQAYDMKAVAAVVTSEPA